MALMVDGEKADRVHIVGDPPSSLIHRSDPEIRGENFLYLLRLVQAPG